MKKTLKYYLATLLFLTSTLTFAQLPPDADEGGDPVPSPIDGKIMILVLIAVVFAFYILNKKTSKSQ